MITIDLNIDKNLEKVHIKEDVLFNVVLSKNPRLIKKFIKSIHPLYKISDAFFSIVNNYVDFTKDGVSIYTGLIIRTGLDDYAVLYLEGTKIDEEHMLKSIDDYIKDIGDHIPREININQFVIKKNAFLAATKKIQ